MGAGLKHGGDVEGLQAQTENMSGNIQGPHTPSVSHCLSTLRGIGVSKMRERAYCLNLVNRYQRETNPVRTEKTL